MTRGLTSVDEQRFAYGWMRKAADDNETVRHHLDQATAAARIWKLESQQGTS